MTPNDELLVNACINGDNVARKELYDRFAPLMLGVCHRYLRCKEDAQDALHDGFIKVFTSLHKLRKTQSLSAWIHSIMVYTAINSLRHRTDLYDDLSGYDFGTYSSDDEKIVIESFDYEVILDAIHQLPTRYQLVFNLVEIDGYSYNEVAEKLSIETATVRSNLHRAKQILKAKLSQLSSV